MKVIIAGSRAGISREQVRDAIKSCPFRGRISAVVSGGAAGVDTYGAELARKYGKELIVVPAEWKKYGRSAGMKRNSVMAEMAEGLIAVWDGKSPGTANMIETMKSLGKEVWVVIV